MSLYLTGKNHIIKVSVGDYSIPSPSYAFTSPSLTCHRFQFGNTISFSGQLSQQRDRLGARLSTDFRHRIYKQTSSSSHSTFHPLSTGLKRFERKTKLTPITLEMRGVKPPLLITFTAGSTLWNVIRTRQC